MFTPRYYQTEAFEAVYDWLSRNDGNPLIVLPTAAGKSPVIAMITQHAHRYGGRVLVLQHVKELVEQNAAKLEALGEGLDIGIYCAGLKRKQTANAIVYGSIQSIAANPQFPTDFDIVLVDEAHRIPVEGEGQYRKVLGRMPQARVIGLTATPYRMKDGYIYGEKNILNAVCYDAPVRKLIDEGYLSKLRSKDGQAKADFKEIKLTGGDFNANELDRAYSKVAASAASEICELGKDRKAWLVFASGVRHAELMRTAFHLAGIDCELVTGNTPINERDEIVARYKNKQLRCLINVACFTEGFDAPHVDLVALATATMSPGRYYQMVGRGFRLDPEKDDCLVLDFGENISRHGAVDAILPVTRKRKKEGGEAPTKSCPDCYEIVHLSATECPQCGHTFERKATINKSASTASILTQPVWLDCTGMALSRHRKSGGQDSVKVTYRCGLQFFYEWVCPEHSGFAKRKATQWWREHGGTSSPETINDWLESQDELTKPARVLLRREGKYTRVANFSFVPGEAA